MNPSSRFARRIRRSVQAELDAASAREARGEPITAFAHLERAHILSQQSTVEHVRVHWAMFRWALREHVPHEAFGQSWRLLGAALKTWIGCVPTGNTGGADVSGFKRMPIPADLQRLIDAAQS